MNVRDRWVSAAAGASLLAAMALAGSSLFGALRVESAAMPSAPSLMPAGDDLGVEDPGRIVANDALQEAVENDLFQPERRALQERYRLPGDAVVESPREEEPRQAPDFRVVGSAVLTGSSFALLQSDDDPPYAVRMGETFRGYRVTSVDAEWVTVSGPAGQITIPVQAAVVASGNRNGNGNADRNQRSRNQDRDDDDDDERGTRQRLEEAQRAIQQLRQLGAAGARMQVPGGAASFQVGPNGQIQVVPLEAPPQARRPGGGGGE